MMENKTMRISVTYAEPSKQRWFELEVPIDTCAEEAIRLSGILQQFPEIDLDDNKIGVFGRVIKLQQPLKEGDRVEIYRPITADPETVERRDEED
jgi:putative ubiquitin-RnfH superfamily antitoxin RatB of RatAB toxin-antitoxin module